MEKTKTYMEQDIFNPDYLFHGSSVLVNQLEPRQSKDCNNKDNEDNAIFLTSSFITATAYAFSKNLIKVNEHYSFFMNNNGELPAMEFEIEYLPEDLFGYVYVFKKSSTIIKDKHENTTQYRSYQTITPIDVVKVYYSDFSKFFIRNNKSKLK